MSDKKQNAFPRLSNDELYMLYDFLSRSPSDNQSLNELVMKIESWTELEIDRRENLSESGDDAHI